MTDSTNITELQKSAVSLDGCLRLHELKACKKVKTDFRYTAFKQPDQTWTGYTFCHKYYVPDKLFVTSKSIPVLFFNHIWELLPKFLYVNDIQMKLFFKICDNGTVQAGLHKPLDFPGDGISPEQQYSRLVVVGADMKAACIKLLIKLHEEKVL